MQNSASPRPVFIANWKMNLGRELSVQFVREFAELLLPDDLSRAYIGLAPAAPLLPIVQTQLEQHPGILLGGQNVHWLENGAHTGEISAAMLQECGADFAIVGHSERRQFYGETSEKVSARAKFAIQSGLHAVVCVGESLVDFQSGKTSVVIRAQVNASIATLDAEAAQKLMIAYEPVWAVGTGNTASPAVAESVHALIREELEQKYGKMTARQIPILYGGSIKSENIRELLGQPNIEGALVGGASLEAKSFAEIIRNGRKARP